MTEPWQNSDRWQQWFGGVDCNNGVDMKSYEDLAGTTTRAKGSSASATCGEPDTVRRLVNLIGEQVCELAERAGVIADVIGGCTGPNVPPESQGGDGLLCQLRSITKILTHCLMDMERAQRLL